MNHLKESLENTNSAPLQGLGVITLENMEFHAYHGCLEHEQQLGNTFIVSVAMELDTTHAGETDQLDHTLNYQLVYDVIRGQMEIPSKLIEHVGQRILDSLYDSFHQIRSLHVKLSKLNPPLGGKVDRVTIELHKTRA